MQRIKNQVLAPLQEAQKPIVYDAYFKNDGKAKAVVIFCHGYKGFKDWGSLAFGCRRLCKGRVLFSEI